MFNFINKISIGSGIALLWLMVAGSPIGAAAIIPVNLAVPVPEQTIFVDNEAMIFQDYADVLKELYQDEPPEILGAVRILFEDSHPVTVSIPLIAYSQPGVSMEIVTPNDTGCAWASTDLTGVVDEDGLSVRFTAAKSGSYAVYRAISQRTETTWRYVDRLRNRKSELNSAPAMTAQNSQTWELTSENQRSANKIPLILVHGDNSYREKEDRWNYFLDWVAEHPEFDNKYEIWRFHHVTENLIGYDGKSGNAKELGDAIHQQFGANRRILLLAHSRGGLISRAYMCKYGSGKEGDRVIGLVTLATPHHGSPGAVPDWGLETVSGRFRDTDLANILYGFTEDDVVNVGDVGTMGLAWDNYDGPENGVLYRPFSLESRLGPHHVLSVMDTNMKAPALSAGQTDNTIYRPDTAYGTLEELNQDSRYFGKIIAYGGYDTDLGLGGYNPLNWMNLSFNDHAGLEMAAHILANIRSKSPDAESVDLFAANDGMVPLQSALFLKKDSKNEPMYQVEKSGNWYTPSTYKVKLKDFSSRMNFRKAVLCPDFDHLHMVEGRGGLLKDKSDYWDHVAHSLNELNQLKENEIQNFTPVVTEIDESLPSLSSLASGSNCFVQTVTDCSSVMFLIIGFVMTLIGLWAHSWRRFRSR